MAGIKVIGVGSPFADDDVGWRVVDALQQPSVGLPSTIEFVTSDRPGMCLIQLMDGADYVLLIDAMLQDGPGQQAVFFEGRALSVQAAFISSHGFGVVDALALADSLGRLPASVEVCGIPIALQSGCNPLENINKVDVEARVEEIAGHLSGRLTL